MKISTALIASVTAEWTQPSYYEFINMDTTKMRNHGLSNWGHPLVGNTRKWSDCPALPTPEGALGLRCNAGTCAILCPGGSRAVGRRRTRCRYTKKLGWYWKESLGSCQTCDVETPMSNDPLMTTACKVNENTGRKFCKMNCPADHLAADQKTSFVKVACKCPRQGKNGCSWYHRQRVSNYQNYTCTPRAQPQVGGEDDYSNGNSGNNGATGYENDAGNGSETGYGGAAETTAASAATTAAAAATTAAAASTAAPAAETTAAATAASTAAPTVPVAETTAAATAAPTAAPTAAATTAAPVVTAAPTTAAAPTTTVAPVCPIGSNACPGIDEVNSARGGHNTPAATFDATLTAEAQAWADQLFANGVDPSASDSTTWKDPSTTNGEIVWIAMTPPLADPSVLGVAAAQTFYQQKDNFNHNSFECASGANCDDYTQMMWASSTAMGVGIVQNCDPGQFLCTSYVVMRFNPAGNVAGEYPSNILPATARFPGLMSPSEFLSAIMRNQ